MTKNLLRSLIVIFGTLQEIDTKNTFSVSLEGGLPQILNGLLDA